MTLNLDTNTGFAEKEVYKILKQICTGTEKVELGHLIQSKNGTKHYIPDFYLPNGCKILGQPHKKIFVDIKLRLHTNLISFMKNLVDANDDKDIIFLFVIMELDMGRNLGDGLINNLQSRFDNRLIVISYADLRGYAEGKQEIAENTSSFDVAKTKILKMPTTLFLGAGIGMSAGLPGWNDLQKKLLKKIGYNLDSEHCFDRLCNFLGNSPIVLSQFIDNCYQEKGNDIRGAIREELYRNKKRKYDTIRSIVDLIVHGSDNYTDNGNQNKTFYNKLDVRSIITYNYDDLIEQEMSKAGIRFNSITGFYALDSSAFPIFHVHGILREDASLDIDAQSSFIVFSEQAYHDKYRRAYEWSNVEQLQALRNTLCLFIGLSMNDPNLRRLLAIAKAEEKTDCKSPSVGTKFVFLKNPTTPNGIPCISKLIESNLSRLGVDVIWYSNHNELAGLLRQFYED